ncbi:hypothetical protein C8R47DRAFT_1085270 [Mycena vitilis]|nr:hypothetical protein C8R47DRAFT_1085270 [Mycena vitilis]
MSHSLCAVCGNGFTSSLAPNPNQTLELTNVLRSNAVPSDVGSFRSTILAAPTELARYDAEIERIQNILAGLVSERSALATYAKGCRSALSPIRRVPTELWAKIFDLCSPNLFRGGEEGYKLLLSTTSQDEVDRLAHLHLLQCAQVSSLWHKIAMETPKLWSTIALDTSLWAGAPVSYTKLLSLLDVSLQRGGNHPLVMDIAVLEEDPHSHAVMILLSQHATRWKAVYFYSDLDSAQLLSRARGHLGQLQRLDVYADWKGVDIFQVAPQLKNVKFYGRIENVPHLPWGQIRSFQYVDDEDAEASNFLSLLGRCPNILTFISKVTLLQAQAPIDTTLTSEVEFVTLRLALVDIPPDTPFGRVVGRIFESLTLPSLRSLAVTYRDESPEQLPPIWDTDQFLGLAERSSFHSHLTRLEIDAIITDEGLLGCLAVLPLLEELIIFDCMFDDEHIVITDTLLRGLVHQGDVTTMVPELNFLSFTSRGHFTTSAYHDLLVSRLPDSDESFKAHLWLLPDHRSESSQESLLADIDNVDHKGTFSYTCGPPG